MRFAMLLFMLLLFLTAAPVLSFTVSRSRSWFTIVSAGATSVPHREEVLLREGDLIYDGGGANGGAVEVNRRCFMGVVSLTGIVAFTSASFSFPDAAEALVKGNAPPPKKEATEERKKCRNVEECQEMAERLAAQEEAEMKANMRPLSVASGGTRYRDLDDGDPSSAEVKTGSDVTVRYRVLKLGKRSYDGVSGEGTVVFSRGYGLEDDEKQPGDKSFSFEVGDPSVIAALSDGISGMRIGGLRRISVLPQNGWEVPSKECDGGPGGSGAGGDLKTDYVVVPTATMVATEICFDKTKLPFPTSYAQQRRMAQRFDQSLIIEVELINIA